MVQRQTASKVRAAGGKAGEEPMGGLREWMAGEGGGQEGNGCLEEGGDWQDASGCWEGTWKLV